MKLNCFTKDRMDTCECPKCRYYKDCKNIVKGYREALQNIRKDILYGETKDTYTFLKSDWDEYEEEAEK